MKKYQIVYADPPWDYGSFPSTSDTHAYPLMTTKDICGLPVASIVHPDAMLFLWATMSKLPDAFAVIDAWGFKYVTNGFTWVKTNPRSGSHFLGMGGWTRQNAELCLVAKQGRPSRRDRGVSSVVVAPRGKHSQKPAVVRDRIVRLCGDVPRVELFARSKSLVGMFGEMNCKNDVELEGRVDGEHASTGGLR